MQKGISTRFDDNTLIRLEEMADNLGTSRSSIIKNAVNHYLEYLTWYAEEARQGEDDIERGDFKTHDDIKAKFKRLGVKCK